MKIVLIGENTPGGLPETFRRSFEDLGHEVKILDEWTFYRKSSRLASSRIGHRLFWRWFAGPVQNFILREVRSYAPDLVLVFKGWLLRPETIEGMKSAGAKVFNYNPDNPFHNKYHGITNSWIKKAIPFYDCYFIWAKFMVDRLLAAGAKRAEFLPLAYDPQDYHPVEITPEEKKIFSSDVAFVGSWDRERDEWLTPLLDLDIKIWGNSWEKASGPLREKWQGRAVSGSEFAKICAASKIMLNFTRDQTGEGHNMRTFEIPACSGFMLAVRTEGQKEFFPENIAAVYFTGPIELREKINYYLSRENERLAIAKKGHEMAIHGGHTYTERAARIIAIYKELV